MPTAPFLAPERDQQTTFHRAKSGGGTVYYVWLGATIGATSTFALSTNTDYYWPSGILDGPVIVDQFAIEVVTTGTATNIRVGVYASDRDFQPVGPPIVDSGDIAVGTTGVKTYTPGTPVYLARGHYLNVMNADGTVTLRSTLTPPVNGPVQTGALANFVSELSVGRTYAAFPTPGTAWTGIGGLTTAGRSNCIVWRVLA
jgi:hypothetical protein